MKSVILCAGYATRMWPLTKNRPKPLLMIKGRPILDYILEKVMRIKQVEEVILVSNSRFYKNFCEYAGSREFSKNIKILDDGTTTNSNRLGGIGNLWFAIERSGLNNDYLVVLGDNFFDFSLQNFFDFSLKHRKITLGIVELEREKLKHFGVVEIRGNKIISFEEKPSKPKSNFASTGIYFIPKERLKNIKEYLNSGFSREGVGYFIEWMLKKEEVYAMHLKGRWHDIGSIEEYEKVK